MGWYVDTKIVGRGFDKIKEACTRYDGRLPEYNINAAGIMMLCKACDKYLELVTRCVANCDNIAFL